MPDNTPAEIERESIDTLRIPTSMLNRLPDRVQRLVNDDGLSGIAVRTRTLRMLAEHEYYTRKLHDEAAKNDAREMLTVEIEASDIADTADELAALRADNDEMQEKIVRQQRRIEDLIARLAETAAAVNAEPSQR